MARSRSRSETSGAGVHLPRAIAAGAAAVVCLGVAVPKVMEIFSESAAEKMVYMDASLIPFDPNPPPGSAPPEGGEPAAAVPDGPEVHVTEMVEEEAPPPPKPVIETSADGDIAVSMKLRWPQFETGDRVLARVKFTNHSLRTVYLPAAGEPDQGFAVVVEDASGNEVRRVVETAKGDQLPRRMAKLESAAEVEFPVTIVAEDETPLPPGTYTAYAELKPDPRLGRVGLALWTAPKGPIRTDPVTLVVAAREAK